MGLHDLLLADLLPTIHASADRLPQVGKMEKTMPLWCQLKEFFFFWNVEEFLIGWSVFFCFKGVQDGGDHAAVVPVETIFRPRSHR